MGYSIGKTVPLTPPDEDEDETELSKVIRRHHEKVPEKKFCAQEEKFRAQRKELVAKRQQLAEWRSSARTNRIRDDALQQHDAQEEQLRAQEEQLRAQEEQLRAEKEADDDIILKTIVLCSRPLASVPSGGLKKYSPVAPCKHDYYKLTTESKAGKDEVHVLEKVSESTCGLLRGTKVNLSPYRDVANEKVRLTIDFKSYKVPAYAMYKALINGAYVYRLFTHNCWQYGHETVKVVIQLILDKYPDMPKADRDHFETAIADVEGKERPNVRDTAGLLCNRHSNKNAETWRRLENRCRGKPLVEGSATFLRKRLRKRLS